MIPDADLFFRDEIITDKIGGDGFIGDNKAVGPAYGEMHTEMMEMKLQPPVSILSLTKERKAFDLSNLLTGQFVYISVHLRSRLNLYH